MATYFDSGLIAQNSNYQGRTHSLGLSNRSTGDLLSSDIYLGPASTRCFRSQSVRPLPVRGHSIQSESGQPHCVQPCNIAFGLEPGLNKVFTPQQYISVYISVYMFVYMSFSPSQNHHESGQQSCSMVIYKSTAFFLRSCHHSYCYCYAPHIVTFWVTMP